MGFNRVQISGEKARFRLTPLIIAAFIAIAALLLIALISPGGAGAQQSAATATVITAAPNLPPAPDKRASELGNLDSMLSHMAASVQDGYFTANDAASQASLHTEEDSVAVTFYLNGDAAPLLAFLQSNGVEPRNIGDGYVEAYAPVTLLVEASERPNVTKARAITPADAPTWRVITQGVGAHDVDAWHAAGYTGEGVKIGIIDAGFEGFSALMGSELPDEVEIEARCYTSIGEFRTQFSSACEDLTDHGARVAETLLDIAPDAALYIANPISKGDDAAVVEWMASQGVDVVNFSASWDWDGPGDGTSPFSNSPLNGVDAMVGSGAIWVNSAGNRAEDTWFGEFQDPDSDGWLNFSGDIELNEVELESGYIFDVQLRWDDSWDGAISDLDLYLFREGDFTNPINRFGAGFNSQQGRRGDTPHERVFYVPDADGRYFLGVRRSGGGVPDWVQLQSFRGDDLGVSTGGGSIGNPAESANPGMITVGAAHYWDLNALAASSSRGPTPDGRIKPDIVGVDCGRTYTDGVGSTLANGQRCWFKGTSQAAPHIAGLAALVKQRFPEYGPVEIVNYLKSNAEPRGVVPNNDWGYGFAKLPSPTSAGDTLLTPTPSPTPSPTFTPVPTATSTPISTPEPTPSGTAVGAATPIGGVAELEGEVRTLKSRISAQDRVIESLRGLIRTLTDRLDALDGGSAAPTATPTVTHTPTPTSTPVASMRILARCGTTALRCAGAA